MYRAAVVRLGPTRRVAVACLTVGVALTVAAPGGAHPASCGRARTRRRPRSLA
jgi:hypothetical protein